jgi:DNA-binding NtrC family response regulator
MTDDLVLEALHFKRLLRAAAKPGQSASRDPAGDVMPGNDAGPPAVPSACTGAAVKPLQQAMAEAQAQSIHVALAATNGNKAAAARLLGISRAALYEKLSTGSGANGP